jgi:hypothetical protein
MISSMSFELVLKAKSSIYLASGKRCAWCIVVAKQETKCTTRIAKYQSAVVRSCWQLLG